MRTWLASVGLLLSIASCSKSDSAKGDSAKAGSAKAEPAKAGAAKGGTVEVTVSANVRAQVPADAEPAATRYPDQHKYMLPRDSFLLLQGVDESGDGGCATMLEQQYARMEADKQAGGDTRVDEFEWRTTLGQRSMYALLGIRGADEVHPIRALSFCDGDTMVGVTVSARSELSAEDNAVFDRVVASLARP